MRHKIEIGGAPCPTCGFKINSRKASRPFVIEDDSMEETVEREVGHTQNAEQFLGDVADHLKVQPQPSDGGVAGEPVAIDSVAQRIEQSEPDEGRKDAGSTPVAVALPPVLGNEGREEEPS